MYSAVVQKPFEVQENFRQEAVRLKITSIFSIPEENAQFLSMLGAENAFCVVKYSTNTIFWKVANYFSVLKIARKFPSQQRRR